jgi:predicted ATPase
VPDAVAAVLGTTQQPDKSVSESVAAALEGRVRLLVLDNCEHVLAAAADLIGARVAQERGDPDSPQLRLFAVGAERLMHSP